VEKAPRRILCVRTAEGKRHDYKLLKDSRRRLKPQTQAVYDADYQGAPKEHANPLLPIKKPKGGKLTKAQKRFNTSVAQERIGNENVIGSLKRFKIAAERYRNRRKRYGLRITLLAALHNMELE
jgi:DDE superfamily endonuclease